MIYKKIIILLILALPVCWIYLFPQESNEDLTCSSIGCHSDVVKFDNLHPPIDDGCDACHESNENKHPETVGSEFKLIAEVPDLCYECHDSKNEKKVIHPPVEDGECLSCHSPHGSSQESLLISESDENICRTCHDFEIENMKMQHDPVENNLCVDCHNPHESDNTSLLIKNPPELCYECHDGIEEQQGLSDIHPPFEEDCYDCHEVHVSSKLSLLKSEPPDLCFSCHEDMKELLSDSVLIHRPVLEDKKCINCHSPHSAENAAILIVEEQKLCFNCHSKKIEIGERTIPNIKEKTMRKFLHAPLITDGCRACHNPHASKNDFLLSDKFQNSDYVEGKVESFSLCFSCHDEKLLVLDSTSSATKFRAGNKNLHYLHVNKDKGRNCTFCHDVHGSDSKGLVRNEVLFGKWMMPINFEKKNTGGSCTPGCHKEFSYDRLKFLNYVAGIIKGSLIIDKGKTKKSISGLEVYIKGKNSKYHKTIILGVDQSFHFEGIPPGEYEASLDNRKMRKLRLKSDNPLLTFSIENVPEGDVEDSIDFNYYTVSGAIAKKSKPVVKTKTLAQRRKAIEKKLTPDRDKIISFSTGKRTANLTNSIKKYLFDLIEYLKTHPAAKVSLIGHTDNQGTLDQNTVLSQQRAKAVAKFIISKGIAKTRIYTSGKGSLYPIAKNDTPQGRKKNNRIEIKILNK